MISQLDIFKIESKEKVLNSLKLHNVVDHIHITYELFFQIAIKVAKKSNVLAKDNLRAV